MLMYAAGIMRPRLARLFVPSLVSALVLLLVLAPVVFATPRPRAVTLVGPKGVYLALGDSLAFGYQPDLNYDEGYANDFYANLQKHSANSSANMGCPGETSTTFINGGCPYPFLRKFPYLGAQLNAALFYLALLPGQVSPVTLDIGANDILSTITTTNCAVDVSKFQSNLATLDTNLSQTILPKLHAALMVNGKLTGDLLVMNYYDPYQNSCPNTLPYVQTVNQHIANDIRGYATLVDVFSAFGGSTSSHICSYTWECSIFHDTHATSTGYGVMAQAFEQRAGY